MLNEKEIERLLAGVTKTGKVIIGAKEVGNSVKGSKLIIYSSSLSEKWISRIVDTCRSNSVSFFEFQGSSVVLGKICGKLFPVSAMAIRSAGEIDISPLVTEAK